MRKFSLVGLVMALCILFSCSLVQAQDLRTISVDGSSTIKVTPDKVAHNEPTIETTLITREPAGNRENMNNPRACVAITKSTVIMFISHQLP